MFCPSCGSQIPNEATFCPNCGAPIPRAAETPAPVAQEPVAQPAPAPAEPVPTYQAPTYQAPSYQQAPQQPGYQQQTSYQQQAQPLIPALPKNFSMPSVGDLFAGLNTQITSYAEASGVQMKWQKAIVILMYVGVLSSILTAFQYFTGSIYGGSASYVYSSYPAMKVIDLLYCLFALAYAAGMLYARMLLAKYKADGPRFFLLLLLANGAAAVIMALLTYFVTGVSDTPSLVGQIIGIGIAFLLNKTYYEKRMFLFSD